jgi:hypothetical protein
MFDEELNRPISPHLYVEDRPGVQPLDLATLAERVLADVPPQGQLTSVVLEPGRAQVLVFPPIPDPSTFKGKVPSSTPGCSSSTMPGTSVSPTSSCSVRWV